jgi:hypothetical protein
MDLSKYNRDREFSEISHQLMPELQFPPTWKIKMLWPFGGAAARFVVTKGDCRVSVYADYDASLGCMDYPYWEIYPSVDGDTWRGRLEDGDALIEAISFAIGKQEADRT